MPGALLCQCDRNFLGKPAAVPDPLPKGAPIFLCRAAKQSRQPAKLRAGPHPAEPASNVGRPPKHNHHTAAAGLLKRHNPALSLPECVHVINHAFFMGAVFPGDTKPLVESTLRKRVLEILGVVWSKLGKCTLQCVENKAREYGLDVAQVLRLGGPLIPEAVAFCKPVKKPRAAAKKSTTKAPTGNKKPTKKRTAMPLAKKDTKVHGTRRSARGAGALLTFTPHPTLPAAGVAATPGGLALKVESGTPLKAGPGTESFPFADLPLDLPTGDLPVGSDARLELPGQVAGLTGAEAFPFPAPPPVPDNPSDGLRREGPARVELPAHEEEEDLLVVTGPGAAALEQFFS